MCQIWGQIYKLELGPCQRDHDTPPAPPPIVGWDFRPSEPPLLHDLPLATNYRLPSPYYFEYEEITIISGKNISIWMTCSFGAKLPFYNNYRNFQLQRQSTSKFFGWWSSKKWSTIRQYHLNMRLKSRIGYIVITITFQMVISQFFHI